MKKESEPTAGPPALSSPVEDDDGRARDVLGRLFMFELGADVAARFGTEFKRIRAEAVAAEREACAQIADRLWTEPQLDIAHFIRRRGDK